MKPTRQQYTVEVDYKNYQTGEISTTRIKATYSTLRGAVSTASKYDGICVPADGVKLSETWGRVIRL